MSSTFLTDHSQVLWFSLIARNAGQRPSQLVGINDEIEALRFDATCTLRLVMHDNQQNRDMAMMIGGSLFGSPEPSENSGEQVQYV